MPNEKNNYEWYENTISSIRTSVARFRKNSGDPRHDKHGLGIDSDDRFRVFTIAFSLDAWDGIYGSSGCSTAFNIGDKEIFIPAFKKVLQHTMLELLEQTADLMERESTDLKEKEISLLKERLKELTKTNPDDNKDACKSK